MGRFAWSLRPGPACRTSIRALDGSAQKREEANEHEAEGRQANAYNTNIDFNSRPQAYIEKFPSRIK